MAKKKKRIPKRVAGFKVPKSMRKSVMLKSLLGSQFGRDILANAIKAAAGAAVAVLVANREDAAEVGTKAAKKVGKKSKKTANLFVEAAESATSAVFEVLSEAADSVIPYKKAAKKNADAPKSTARH